MSSCPTLPVSCLGRGTAIRWGFALYSQSSSSAETVY